MTRKTPNQQDSGKFLVLDDDGNAVPVDLKRESIVTASHIHNSISRLSNAVYITHTGYIKGSDYGNNNKAFVFPIDFVAAKKMRIIFASVAMKFTDESDALTNRAKTLEIHMTTPDGTQTGHASYPMVPSTSRTVAVSCSHVFEPGARYNAKLCFDSASSAALLDIACVTVFYAML